METGMVVLGGVFLGAGTLIAWSGRRRRAIWSRLERHGFVACEEDAGAILEAFNGLAGGHGAATPRRYEVGACYKKAAGRGTAYRFTVADLTNAGEERNSLGGRFDAYLVELRDPERVARRPISVFLAPGASGILRSLIAKLIEADPHGAPLELPRSVGGSPFLAAFGEGSGTVNEALPGPTQDRLARAADHGFFAAHFGGGKAAFVALPDRPDVERQWGYVVEWM